MKYAEIIVDISTQALDRIFTYAIPESLEQEVSVGCQVKIPFGQGNRERKGYVMRIKDTPDYEESKIKSILRVCCDASLVEGQLLRLAYWMKEQYGSTLVQALMTVLPMKARMKEKEIRYVRLLLSQEQTKTLLVTYEKKHYVGKVRLLKALLEDRQIARTMITNTLHVADSTIKALVRDGVVEETTIREYRNPVTGAEGILPIHNLNREQQQVFDCFCRDYDRGCYRTYLLYGVTGSGKTEVYLKMIERVLEEGREAIVLIPEIALTYQTVRRFANRFGELVTVIHSRLSKGERYDQFERARKGEVKVVIGPRSALFVPFPNLGLIILDEEHESSYKSEGPPKYHARETAIARAGLANASVVLGSATPSVESFERAQKGQYQMLRLQNRAASAILPTVEVVDMRKELEAHNYSMFSRNLQKYLQKCLDRGEQSILFINRRGYASFVSCRKCGYVVKCPHCDVSLKLHGTTELLCHYCGYHTRLPNHCPECASRYIRAFGTGTEKVVEQLKKLLPKARILRMDADTTRKKGGHEKVLQAFSNEEADILVGTQMIVKGHDFPNVTLVGALAADLSLFEQDFRASERTFDLLTQAAGRAGRGEKPGHMIIQTYQPEQYSIVAAAKQDYEAFYKEEAAYRKLMKYPPFSHMLALFMAADSKEQVEQSAQKIAAYVRKLISCTSSSLADGEIRGPYFKMQEKNPVQMIGPSEATVFKVQDVYRKLLYVKHPNYEILVQIKNQVENYIKSEKFSNRTRVYFDFDPMTMY